MAVKYVRRVKIADSSQIDEVHYDPSSGEMVIVFRNGAKYRYENVGHVTFGILVGSDSVGKAFNMFVKDKHKTEKIT